MEVAYCEKFEFGSLQAICSTTVLSVSKEKWMIFWLSRNSRASWINAH